MNKSYLIFLSIILSTNIIYGQSDTAKNILDQLNGKTQNYSDITAEFSYNLSNPSQGIEEDMNGKIWIKGNMYKLNMSEELSVINNGETLWYFMKDIQEVQIMQSDPDDDMNLSKIFTIYENEYRYDYKGKTLLNERTVHSIFLYPEEGGNISKVSLLIDEENVEIVNIKIHDKEGGIVTYNIIEFSVNSSLPNDLFEFIKEDYPEVEIIDLR